MDAAITQLLAYCQADPVFFEPPWRWDDRDSRFAVPALPDGWQAREDRLWVLLQPPGVVLPEQGWKIHVSAAAAEAAEVCRLVVDFCLARGIALKYLRSGALVRFLNSKYADRGSSGKLLTLYPVDENQLTDVLPALAELLRGRTGPYVLSDLRYGDSTVYVRYGAFRPMTYLSPGGELVQAVRDPDGRLVPDERNPVFTVPSWVTVPPVLHESIAKLQAGDPGEFPFVVERPLHFSNGGGVYLARHKDTDGYVVLREARPHAGLDRDGLDAVGRLQRERAVLERLDGLECVPRLLDYRVIWEHHFLVEEYVDGKSLMEEVFARYPLVGPDQSPETLAGYTQWATGVLAKIDHALMQIHSRGLRYVDLHPGNILLRPDGRVVLVDYEISTDLTDQRPVALAAPGFAAPATMYGRAADAYVLNCLRQWVFLPITPLQDRDPAKRASLTHVITGQFPLPPGFGPRMIRTFAEGRELGEDRTAALFETPRWSELRDAIAGGILASATPERTDRLFPGDPQQHVSGGFTVGHGAAGVLWALRQAGVDVPEEHTDWLVRAARRADDPRPGLLDGLHGTAAVLEALGRRDAALDVLERARKLDDSLVAPGIHSGLAGAGLNLLHFHRLTGDDDLRTDAVECGERLAVQLDDAESPLRTPRARVGLQHGLTGVALFLLRLYDATRDPRHLDLAHTALRYEIDRGHTLPDGTFQLLEANRYHAYLGTGSIGLALVLAEYQSHRDEPRFDPVIEGARRACRAPFVRHPFLFMGRAGTIAALHLLGRPDDRPLVDAHVRRLGWHALPYQGHLAFPGNQLLRLSMDLLTGAAGVLAALGVAFDQNASVIPVVDLKGGEHHGLRPAAAGSVGS